MNNLKKIIGSRIRALRKARELSQEELAGIMGRSVFTISQIERGINFPKIDTLLDLTKGLQCSVSDILSGAEDVQLSLAKPPERQRLEQSIWANIATMDMQTLRATQVAVTAMISAKEKRKDYSGSC